MALAAAFTLFLGTSDVLAGFRALPPWAAVLLPAAGGLVAGLVGEVLVRGKSGAAFADVMEAVALGRGRVSLRLVLGKALASYAAIAAGGSLGREGSILQFGAAIGSVTGERFRLRPRELRALVAAGTAAGFAAAYNTPIAAAVFVIEVITGVVSLDVLLPVLVATVIATMLERVTLGGLPLYGQRSFELVTRGEIVAHAAVGLLAGVVGPLFMASLFEVEARVRVSRVRRPIAAMFGGLVVGLLAVRWPEVTGNGFEAIQETLDGHAVGAVLVGLLLAKGAATIASVATGSPGGVFTPSMFLGAALGGAVGGLVPHLFPAAGPSGGYALVGMAAMLAATTHAPLMAATLAFELSGDYAIVLPLLLATGLASFVSRSLHAESVYTEELRRRGIHWQGSLTQRLARAVRARDILTVNVPEVAPDAPIDDVLRHFEDGARAVYVVDPDRNLVRVVALQQARLVWAARAKGEPGPRTAGEAAVHVETASPDDNLLALSEKLWNLDQGEIAVVEDAPPRRMLGVVTRRDVLGAIDREVLDRDVLLTRIVRFEDHGGSADFLELPAGWVAQNVGVSRGLAGTRLDPGDVRDRLGCVVVGVRGRRGPLEDVRGRTLHAGDRLLVLGTAEAIDAFARETAG